MTPTTALTSRCPVLAYSVVVVLATSPPVLSNGLRLEGAILTYSQSSIGDHSDWDEDLEAMAGAGLSTFVLDCAGLGQNAADNGIGIILDLAARYGQHVFLGLRPNDVPGAIETLQRYAEHRAFGGLCVVAGEVGEAVEPEAIKRVRAALAPVGGPEHRPTQGKPVALLVRLASGATPEVTREAVEALLLDTDIDTLILQVDGAAAGRCEAMIGQVRPCLEACRDACLTAGVVLWAALDGSPESGLDELARQLTVAAPFVRRCLDAGLDQAARPAMPDTGEPWLEQYTRRFIRQDFYPTRGPSVTLDPTFSYYRDRSPESIAAEIRSNGYSIAHCVLPADLDLDDGLLAAFHREGIGIWFMTFGNGTYSTAHLPDGWQSWRMVTRSDLEGNPHLDGFTRLCLNNPHYRAWKKAQLSRILKGGGIDGIDIAEPHWPEYPGITSPAYACFCPACLDAFRSMFPEERVLPDIIHPDSPRSPERSPELWRKWLAFREASLTGFLDDLVNGPGGIRQQAPEVQVATWSLALRGEDGVRRVLADSGENAGRIVDVVRPDIHCLQTHWPDWIRANLRPDYVEAYRPFVEQIRETSPDAALMIQADTGSQKQNRRSWQWIHAFEAACCGLGVESTTFYAYNLGQYMYSDPPRITEVRRYREEVELHFTKRLDPESAGKAGSYALEPGRVTGVRIDGNRVLLRVSGVAEGTRCTLTVRRIGDDTRQRLFKDAAAAVLDSQTVRFTY